MSSLFAIPRWVALIACAAVVVTAMVVATGDMLAAVVLGDIADGLVLFAWIAAALGIGRLLPLPLRAGANIGVFPPVDALSQPLPLTPSFSTRGNGREFDPLLQIATAIGIGLGAIGFLVLALGLAGLLNRTTSIAIVVAGLSSLAWSYRNQRLTDVSRWLTTKSIGNTFCVLLSFPLAIAVVAASLFPGLLWKPLDPHPYDVMSYHLQIPREWFQIGRIIPLHHNAFSYFPMGVEMHDLLAMHLLGGPWAGMYLCQFMSVAFAGLMVLAVVGAARQFGASSPVAWLSGLLVACVPWTTMLASVCYVETAVMLYTVLAVTWAMIGLQKQMRFSAMAIAGICCGLACGAKYTPFAMTAVPLFAFWPLAAWRTRVRQWPRPWLLSCFCCIVVAAPWLVRNMVWAGNPVFPLLPTMIGPGDFTPDQIDRYRLAHEPPPAERSTAARLTVGYHRVMIDPQFGYIFPWLTLLAAGNLVLRRRFLLVTAMAIATAAIWLLATHDEPRFLTPLIPIAALLIAWAASSPNAAWPVGIILISQCVISLCWTWQTLSADLQDGRQAYFRLPSPGAFDSDELQAAKKAGGKIALVGGADAFYQDVDSSQLVYRNVFNVNIPSGVSTADGWLGQSVEQLRRQGYWVIINTDELNRLSKTYAHIPAPTPPYDQAGVLPQVLPPIGPSRWPNRRQHFGSPS